MPAASAVGAPFAGAARFASESGSRVYVRRYFSTASEIAFSDSIAVFSVSPICAVSHSTASEGKSSSTNPTEISFHSPCSRTSPIFTCSTFSPTVSVASRISTGSSARLSSTSAPPICISAAPTGVSQRTSGRPAAPVIRDGLPGSFSSTNRFINATRAPAVSVAKVCALRVVRYLVNSVSSCRHAAANACRNARLGPVNGVAFPVGAAGGAPTLFGFELDSWAASAQVTATGRNTATVAATIVFRKDKFLLLRAAQNLRKVLCKLRPRHHFIAPGRARLLRQIHLYVRQKSNHAHAILPGSHALDGLNRSVSCVQIDNH